MKEMKVIIMILIYSFLGSIWKIKAGSSSKGLKNEKKHVNISKNE